MVTRAQPSRMVAVASSAIAAIGHDPASRTLFVRFQSGETYGYLDVPAAVFDAFLAAPSKGAFFQAQVDPVFRYVRLAS